MTKGYIAAATILLLRDAPEFEVLMIERHEDIAFAGGAMVFPGGRIGPSDSDEEWEDYCDGQSDFPSEQLTPRIAAIREAFEETGLLLARRFDTEELLTDAEIERLGPWRRQVERNDALFLQLIRDEGLRLCTDHLRLFARWRPPAQATHRRFNTWFFAAAAPAGQSAREDGNEATDAIWTTPADVLADREKGARKMIFPTARNTELLACSNSVQEVFDFASTRKIEPIQPEIKERDGAKFVTIPEGLGYPVTEESLETALRT